MPKEERVYWRQSCPPFLPWAPLCFLPLGSNAPGLRQIPRPVGWHPRARESRALGESEEWEEGYSPCLASYKQWKCQWGATVPTQNLPCVTGYWKEPGRMLSLRKELERQKIPSPLAGQAIFFQLRVERRMNMIQVLDERISPGELPQRRPGGSTRFKTVVPGESVRSGRFILMIDEARISS